MRMKIYLSALIYAIFFSSFPAKTEAVAAMKAQTQQNMISRCTVKDSTGTPLNVRSTPGGKRIVGRLKNGTRVYVENYSGDAKDQSWAEVRLSPKRNSKSLGWVLQDFLKCED